MTESTGQALNLRIWLACLATQELLCVYLGIRLGLYECLATKGAATPSQLAARAGIAPRYAREWLEQQAVAAILAVSDATQPAEARSYSLPHGHADVLTSSASLLSRVASILPLGGVATALPALLAAYKSGNGLAEDAFGADWSDGHADANRAFFVHQLIPWFRIALPEVDQRLRAGNARIADIACGAGWSCIAFARAFPGARVHGLDMSAGMIEKARSNAALAGLDQRIELEVRDCSDPALARCYEVVCLFDALHEIGPAVQLLRSCRAMCADGGGVLVMDARVAEVFTAPGDEIERFQYTTSVLHCLPACLAELPSAATGTVMRVEAVNAFAMEAGFTRCDVLASADRFHRFYWLTA